MPLDAVATPDSTVPSILAKLPGGSTGFSKPWVPAREISNRLNATSSRGFALCGVLDPFDRDFSVGDSQPIAWSTIQIPRAFRPALDQLLSFARLTENWDNDNGRAPNFSTMARAFNFFVETAQYARIPRLFVVGDGEIGFSWEGASGSAQISFHDDTDVVVLAKSGDLSVRGVFTADSLPRDKVEQNK